MAKFVHMNSWRRFCPVFSLTKFVIMNSWRCFCRVFLADKICPHKFMATILSCFFAHKIRHYEFMATIWSCLFRLHNSSSWILGDDFVVSFSLTKFVIMNSWRWFCRVFFANKIRHYGFMTRILSCFFQWQNSSTWILGDDFVLFFR